MERRKFSRWLHKVWLFCRPNLLKYIDHLLKCHNKEHLKILSIERGEDHSVFDNSECNYLCQLRWTICLDEQISTPERNFRVNSTCIYRDFSSPWDWRNHSMLRKCSTVRLWTIPCRRRANRRLDNSPRWRFASRIRRFELARNRCGDPNNGRYYPIHLSTSFDRRERDRCTTCRQLNERENGSWATTNGLHSLCPMKVFTSDWLWMS